MPVPSARRKPVETTSYSYAHAAKNVAIAVSNLLHFYTHVDTEFLLGKECQASGWPTHKSKCKRQNYLLRIHLCPNEITNPAVFRTLSCPADSTFEDLHEALQVAFGWATTHTHDFKIKDPVEEARREIREAAEANMTQEEEMLKIMQNIDTIGSPIPPQRYLLRLVEANPYGPSGPMGWKGIDFVHNASRKHPLTPEKKSHMIKIHEVLEKPIWKDKPFEYEYDFGDCWTHDITVVGRKTATDFYMCTDGDGHGVAEDVGHTPGWEKLKVAYRAARPNKEQKDKIRWFEEMASNGDPRGLGNGGERRWAKG